MEGQTAGRVSHHLSPRSSQKRKKVGINERKRTQDPTRGALPRGRKGRRNENNVEDHRYVKKLNLLRDRYGGQKR